MTSSATFSQFRSSLRVAAWIVLALLPPLTAAGSPFDTRTIVQEGPESKQTTTTSPHQGLPDDRKTARDRGSANSGVSPQTGSQAGTAPKAAESTPSEREMELGEIYEKQGHLADAEKAYAKALETASGVEREAAKKHLKDLFDREEYFQHKYLAPSFDEASSGFWKSLFGWVETLLFLAMVWFLAKIVRRLGERRGKNKLQITDFIDATGEGGAIALAEQVRNAIEQMQEYYKPRDRFRFGSYNSLLVVASPASDELVELATEVVSSTAGKLISFFTKGFFRPQYKITGMVQKTGFQYSCRVKLFGKGSVLRSWERKFPARECPEMQEQLAFEVAMYLKETVDVDGN